MDLKIVDADNHYYEPADAFTRHASPRMVHEQFVRWLTEADGKRKRLLFGDQMVSMIANPTFERLAQPGAFHDRLKHLERGERDAGSIYGDLGPMRPEYRDRAARVRVMDDQGVETAILFPTLALVVEGHVREAEMLHQCLHAFNEWLDDDWGFARDARIIAPPHLSMTDVDRAVVELDWVLERGAKVISIRPGPVDGRSPADPHFDPFWARINEAGVIVAYHALGGPSAYSEGFAQLWGRQPLTHPNHLDILEFALVGLERPALDTMLALTLHNLFGRFPNIRVASIEMGSAWVPYLLHLLDHAGGLVLRRVDTFGGVLTDRPSDIFKDRVWISPFPEEDMTALAAAVGADHILMGSDWPHPEGVRAPVDFLDCLAGFSEADVRRVVRDNALELVRL